MVDPEIKGLGEVYDVNCYLETEDSRESVTPLEGFDRVMDPYFELVELNGESPLDYHLEDYGPYTNGPKNKELSEDQRELLEQVYDRQDNWSLVFEVETDSKTVRYEPDWNDWRDREDISHEWERKPPSSVKLVGDGPVLRMRIARDYDEDLIHRAAIHHGVEVLEPGNMSGKSRGWLQEIPLYIAHDGQEGLRESVISGSDSLSSLVIDDLTMIDFSRSPGYEKSNMEAAFIYGSKPCITEDFPGDNLAEEIAELYQTASLAGLSMADIEPHELVQDVEGVRPVEHEIVLYNDSLNRSDNWSDFFDMAHSRIGKGTREERDEWADNAAERSRQILEEEEPFDEFIPDYLDELSSIDEDLVLDSRKIRSI